MRQNEHKLCEWPAIVLAEVGNRLVIGHKRPNSHITSTLRPATLKPPTRLNSIEIAVDVKLQQDRGMIAGSAGCFGIDPTKPKLGQIEFFDEDIDHANRIVLAT